MEPRSGLHRQAALFGVAVLGIGLGTAAAAAIVGGWVTEPYGWIPLAAAVIVILAGGGVRSRAAWSGFAIRRAGLRAWAPAIAIPAVVLPAGYAIAVVTGNAQLGLGSTSPLFFAAFTAAIIGAASLDPVLPAPRVSVLSRLSLPAVRSRVSAAASRGSGARPGRPGHGRRLGWVARAADLHRRGVSRRRRAALHPAVRDHDHGHGFHRQRAAYGVRELLARGGVPRRSQRRLVPAERADGGIHRASRRHRR